MQPPEDLSLPFDDWRPGQQLAIRTALHAKTRHTVIQSPVGSGKSTIAAALAQLEEGRTVTLTATKGLEDQYSRTFDWLFDVRGMGNYECLAAKDEHAKYFRLTRRDRNHPVMCDDGACRSGAACTLKDDGCLYFDRYRGALADHHVLTNYSYWLAMRRFSRGLGVASRLICDEAHALPEELMSAYRIEISLSVTKGGGNLPRTCQGWADWATAKIDELKPKGEATEDQRQRKQKLLDSLAMLTKIDDTWAWDVWDSKIIFEPTVPRLLMPLLGDTAIASKIVYLSATITPATLRLLDIPPKDITFRVMKSRFPVDRRPIYLVQCTRVDHRMSGEQTAWWLSRIDKIIGKRLDRRGIIHTVSYQRALDILKASRYRGIMIAPTRASELADAIHRFRHTAPPVILLSPSIGTGFDFPYTAAEYQILAKMPFPDTRSAIARARIAATDGYRDHLTTTAIQQIAGRVMRADDDQGETFICDDHARWFIPKARADGLLSQSFLDAVVWINENDALPLPPPKLKRRVAA